MKRYMAFLLAALVVSCGGGGDDGGSTGGSNPNGGGGGTSVSGGTVVASAFPSMRVEQSDAAVSFSGGWTNSNSGWGWSGGSAVETNVAGATASFVFSGNSVRWLSARGRSMGQALVRVDGDAGRQVDLSANPTNEVRTNAITIYGLSDGPHTLTIEVLSGIVTVDAFDVNPMTTISHLQDTDPNAKFSAGWTKSSTADPWSGNGVSNLPELPVTAQETTTAGETVTLPFRGTGISWQGYRGPDGGVATVQVDGGTPVEVDTYSPTRKFQEVVFTATGLADTSHTLTITATGNKNAASSSARVVVDAFDVMTPGRRYEENDPQITYGNGFWNPHHNSRVWSAGAAATSNITGATATFRFTGTSVSWIGCRKSSAGGTAKVYIDDVFVREIRLHESYPIEGYQMDVFRQDGLPNGPHTLKIEVTSANDGPYVVVDAFDVHP